jgi:hypothetical protein
MRLALLAALIFPAASLSQNYDALRVYAGTWDVNRKGAPKPDRLVNECNLLGTYFACQQTLNGKVMALILFIPREKAGTFYTQAVLTDGSAVGKGQLEIEGDRWTFFSTEGGSTYRTTNVFSGKDRIRFESAESADGKSWKITASGDEKRIVQ